MIDGRIAPMQQKPLAKSIIQNSWIFSFEATIKHENVKFMSVSQTQTFKRTEKFCPKNFVAARGQRDTS